MFKSGSNVDMSASTLGYSALNQRIETVCSQNEVLSLELRQLQKKDKACRTQRENGLDDIEPAVTSPEKPEDSPIDRSSPRTRIFPGEKFIQSDLSSKIEVSGCPCECHRLVQDIFQKPICCACYRTLAQSPKSPRCKLQEVALADLTSGTIREEVEHAINKDLSLKRLDQVKWCAEYEQLLFHFKREHPRLRNVKSFFRALLMTAPFKQLHFSDDNQIKQTSVNVAPQSWRRSSDAPRRSGDRISRLPGPLKEYLEDSFASEIINSLTHLSSLYIEARRQYLHESSINQKNRVIQNELSRRQQRELQSRQARMRSQVRRTRAFLKAKKTLQLADVSTANAETTRLKSCLASASLRSKKQSLKTAKMITKLKETIDNRKVCDYGRTVQMTTEYSKRVQQFGGGSHPLVFRHGERQLLERFVVRIQCMYRSHLAYLYANGLRLISFLWKFKFDQARGKLLKEEFEALYAQLCFKATMDKARFAVFTLMMASSSKPNATSAAYVMIEYATFQLYWIRSMYRASTRRDVIEFLGFVKRQEQKCLDEMDRLRAVQLTPKEKRKELWDQVKRLAMTGVSSHKKEVSRAVLAEMEKSTQKALSKTKEKKKELETKTTENLKSQDDMERLVQVTDDEKAREETRLLATEMAAQVEAKDAVHQTVRYEEPQRAEIGENHLQEPKEVNPPREESTESNVAPRTVLRAKKARKKVVQPKLSLIEVQIDKLLRCIENARQVLAEFPATQATNQPVVVQDAAGCPSTARPAVLEDINDRSKHQEKEQNGEDTKSTAAASTAAVVLERQEHLNEIFRLSWASRVSETVNRLSEPSKPEVDITTTKLRATRRYVQESMRIMNFLKHSLKYTGASKPQLGADLLRWNEKFEQQIRVLDSNLQLVYSSVEV